MQNFYSENFDYDECTSRGMCSIPPSISALQEILLIILKQSAYYILKLKSLDILQEESALNLLSTLTNGLSSNTAYNDNQILEYVHSAYNNLNKNRALYIENMKKLNIKYKDVKNLINLSPDIILSKLISFGEKQFQDKYKKISPEKKNYTDLLLIIIKNIAENIIIAADNNFTDINITEEALHALNLLNNPNTSLNKIDTEIKRLLTLNKKLIKHICELITTEYGQPQKTEVSLSTRNGKAILVSGSNFKELKMLLNSIDNENIDVYTHGLLLSAHIFENFKHIKQLRGHYGSNSDKCLLDFATFPGAILLTKNSNINTEYIYRGRLFTTSNIQPKGVIKITNYNFSEIIKSTKAAKGFAKGQTKEPLTIGYNKNDLENTFSKLKQNLLKSDLKKVLIIWEPQITNTAFKSILNKITKNTFVLSFSKYNINQRNFFEINIAENYILTTNIFTLLFKYIDINKPQLNFCFAKCTTQILSEILYLKINKAKNIYMTNCSPNILNPNLQKFMSEMFNIKLIENIEKELISNFTTE